MFLGLAEERFDVGVGGEADDLKAVGQTFGHVEAVRADGAGGAEHDEAARSASRGRQPPEIRRRKGVGGGRHAGIPSGGSGCATMRVVAL